MCGLTTSITAISSVFTTPTEESKPLRGKQSRTRKQKFLGLVEIVSLCQRQDQYQLEFNIRVTLCTQDQEVLINSPPRKFILYLAKGQIGHLSPRRCCLAWKKWKYSKETLWLSDLKQHPNKVGITPIISCWEKKMAKVWCQPENKLVSWREILWFCHHKKG